MLVLIFSELALKVLKLEHVGVARSRAVSKASHFRQFLFSFGEALVTSCRDAVGVIEVVFDCSGSTTVLGLSGDHCCAPTGSNSEMSLPRYRFTVSGPRIGLTLRLSGLIVTLPEFLQQQI